MKDILTDDECRAAVNGTWDFLESLGTGVLRNEPNSWKDSSWPLMTRGILHYLSVGHMQPLWDVRQNRRVAQAFAEVWRPHERRLANLEPEDLLVSFDGINIMRPPEKMGGVGFRGTPWPHVDQGSSQLGLKCYQGFVNLFDTGPEDGCLTVYERSHSLRDDYFAERKVRTGSKDWYKLPAGETWFQDNGCDVTRVVAPKKSLALWDSRLVHYNSPPIQGRTNPEFRMVFYVSMTPRIWATDAALKKKRNAFANLRMTPHWPHKITLVPKIPQTYGKSLPHCKPLTTAPELTRLGYRLAGFDDEPESKKDSAS